MFTNENDKKVNLKQMIADRDRFGDFSYMIDGTHTLMIHYFDEIKMFCVTRSDEEFEGPIFCDGRNCFRNIEKESWISDALMEKILDPAIYKELKP